MFAASAAALVAVGSMSTPAAADTGWDELAMANELNHRRAELGLPGLTIRGELFDLAREWSRRQAATGAVFHNPLLSHQLPPNWLRMGENVAAGPQAWAMFDAWMASPAHQHNMLDARFDSIGVGVVDAGNGTYYATMVFMKAG